VTHYTRPPEVSAQSEHTLTQYQRGLQTAESLDELKVNLDTQTTAGRRNARRLAMLLSLWAIAVLAIAGVATWFIDRVMAAWIVALVTAIVISVTFPRVR
jgi:Flp pilus assembly protein TadB